jgi:hypothetical protein
LWLLIGKRCAEETACRKKEAEEEKSWMQFTVWHFIDYQDNQDIRIM